jgi:serine protease Do
MKRIALLLFLGSCSFLGGMLAVGVSQRGLPAALGQPPVLGAPGAQTPVLPGTPAADPRPATNDLARFSEQFEWVARRVSPTVVAIEATKPAPAKSSGTTRSKPVEESGSGVLVRMDGHRGVYVITNNHVVHQATPQQITVSLADNRILHPAQVWADPESDVALLRLDVDTLPTAALGDSEKVRVGQWVLAFGSPFGLNQTVTHGIISARERGQISLGSTIRIKDFLQTDAAINPGSSGGPLVDLDGQVIGINTAIASNSGSNSGVAFSIPINLVKYVSKQLLEKGSVTRGYLGLQVAPAFEPTDAARLGLDRAQGAWIERVYAGSPAAEAGLRANDVVLGVDGVVIRNENHFINLISGLPAGRRVRLQVWRERRTLTLEAVVADWSRAQGQFRTLP